MEKELTGSERRQKLISILRNTQVPLSGAELGKQTGVSRQVVVQDMALLRTKGYNIVSTARGYLIPDASMATRLFKVCHTNEQVEDELTTIVDLGGVVIDVTVNHRTYGKVCCSLDIKSRRDVRQFLADIASGKSVPLLNLTSGYHFHKVAAESEDILDEIEEALREKDFLAEFMPYEYDLAL